MLWKNEYDEYWLKFYLKSYEKIECNEQTLLQLDITTTSNEIYSSKMRCRIVCQGTDSGHIIVAVLRKTSSFLVHFLTEKHALSTYLLVKLREKGVLFELLKYFHLKYLKGFFFLSSFGTMKIDDRYWNGSYFLDNLQYFPFESNILLLRKSFFHLN